MFVGLCPRTEISFEHAWYLSQALGSKDEYALVPRRQCHALWIRDLLVLGPVVCPSCRWPPRVVEVDKTSLVRKVVERTINFLCESGNS
jgi:hypothetical protein